MYKFISTVLLTSVFAYNTVNADFYMGFAGNVRNDSYKTSDSGIKVSVFDDFLVKKDKEIASLNEFINRAGAEINGIESSIASSNAQIGYLQNDLLEAGIPGGIGPTPTQILAQISQLEQQIEQYQNQIIQLNLEIVEAQTQISDILIEKDKLTDLYTIKDEASNINFSLSLLWGIMHIFDSNVILGFEGSLDFANSVIGSGKDNEIKSSNNFGGFVTLKAGYQFSNSFGAYLNGGVGFQRQKLSFEITNPNFASKSEISQIVPYFVAGIGFEQRIAEQVSIFTELNYIQSIEKIKFEFDNDRKTELSFNSQEVKIGMRYYF